NIVWKWIRDGSTCNSRIRIVDRVCEDVAASRVLGRQRRGDDTQIRVESGSAVHRDRRKVARSECSRGKRLARVQDRTFLELLIAEEEEALVTAVVDFGNPNGASQSAAKVIAAVAIAVLVAVGRDAVRPRGVEI